MKPPLLLPLLLLPPAVMSGQCSVSIKGSSDIPEHDFHQIPNVGLETCLTKCCGIAKCMSFVYVTSGEPMWGGCQNSSQSCCFLKDASPEPRKSDGNHSVGIVKQGCDDAAQAKTLMNFAKDIHPPPQGWGSPGNGCNWTGVGCERGCVDTIDLGSYGPGGQFIRRLSQMPPVHRSYSLTGTPNLTSLPSSLRYLYLNNNNFVGTPDMTSLPKGLQDLWLNNNNFEGTPQFDSLPEALEQLDFSYNLFTGTPNLTSLPHKLTQLYLTANHFSGVPNFTKLPFWLRYFFVTNNKFTGTPDLSEMPQGVQNVGLTGNHFVGTPDLTALPRGLAILSLDKNKFTGVPDLTALPEGLEELDLSHNQFTGTPDLSQLPTQFYAIDLSHNNLSSLGTNNKGFSTQQDRWCTPCQANMCGTDAGMFNCTSGTWSCKAHSCDNLIR